MVAVATSAHHQAAALSSEMPFPLLLDPDFAFRDAVALRSTFTIRDILKSESGRNYLRALRRGNRPGLVSPKHVRNRPAVLIRRPDGVLAWAHEGRSLGDYPDVATVLAALDELRP